MHSCIYQGSATHRRLTPTPHEFRYPIAWLYIDLDEATGPVRVLTPLRQFGCYFSPLCLFYCWNSADDRLEAVVAEVNNTPWGERH